MGFVLFSLQGCVIVFWVVYVGCVGRVYVGRGSERRWTCCSVLAGWDCLVNDTLLKASAALCEAMEARGTLDTLRSRVVELSGCSTHYVLLHPLYTQEAQSIVARGPGQGAFYKPPQNSRKDIEKLAHTVSP